MGRHVGRSRGCQVCRKRHIKASSSHIQRITRILLQYSTSKDRDAANKPISVTRKRPSAPNVFVPGRLALVHSRAPCSSISIMKTFGTPRSSEVCRARLLPNFVRCMLCQRFRLMQTTNQVDHVRPYRLQMIVYFHAIHLLGIFNVQVKPRRISFSGRSRKRM